MVDAVPVCSPARNPDSCLTTLYLYAYVELGGGFGCGVFLSWIVYLYLHRLPRERYDAPATKT